MTVHNARRAQYGLGPMSPSEPYRPRPLEVAAGALIGEQIGAAPLGPPAEGSSPVGALQAALRRALRRPPCLVSFSGGRDSSALLALAVAVARREGLPAPIPATLVFPDAVEAEETTWQDDVVSHLGIADWHRVEVHDELGALGPEARAGLRRHGVVWPPNTYMLLPLVRAARGGSFVTGVGGDELLSGGTWRATRVLAGRARPRPSDLFRFAYAALPASARSLLWEHMRGAPLRPWLRPAAAQPLNAALSRTEAETPFRWDSSVERFWTTRYAQALRTVLLRFTADQDVLIVHPYLDPAVVAELRRAGGMAGFVDRTTAMKLFFADVLPERAVTRSSKANFREVVWDEGVRAFARSWDGSGVDASLVDVESVREVWQSDRPVYQSLLLLHSAWLACSNGDSAGASDGV